MAAPSSLSFDKPAGGGKSPFSPASPFSAAPAPAFAADDRLNELSRREQELEQRQSLLAKREAELQTQIAAGKGPRPANWPRCPECLPCCKPCLHHDITGEIPRECQGHVRRLYFLWYLTCVCFVWNCFCMVVSLVTVKGELVSVNPLGVVLSIVFLIIGPLYQLYFCYLQAYDAMRLQKSTKFVFFFCFFGLHTLVVIFWLVGWESGGGAGIMLMISLFSNSYHVTGIFVVIQCCLWLMLTVFNLGMIKTIHTYYRGRGGNLSADATAMAGSAAAKGVQSGVQSGAFNGLLAAGAQGAMKSAA